MCAFSDLMDVVKQKLLLRHLIPLTSKLPTSRPDLRSYLYSPCFKIFSLVWISTHIFRLWRPALHSRSTISLTLGDQLRLGSVRRGFPTKALQHNKPPCDEMK
jgi:hypothetical protein